MQGEVENAQREAKRLREERGKFEAEASAALQDAREALARESEIQEQLQKADQVPRHFFMIMMF
jgi:phage shock protein A